MLYRSNTERVLWPLISIATRSLYPFRTISLIADLRRSWNSKPSSPTFSQALTHIFLKLPIRSGCQFSFLSVLLPPVLLILLKTKGKARAPSSNCFFLCSFRTP